MPLSEKLKHQYQEILSQHQTYSLVALSLGILLTTCISGIKFKAVTEKLADLESQQNRFKMIHVVTSSSDCNLNESSCESIVQNVKESIDQTLKISENVQISSILPRTDDQEANIKAENTNLSLKDLCSEYEFLSAIRMSTFA